MPNPLIFLVAIVVIDLVLKSMRNKKKMEETRRNKMEQSGNKTPTSPRETSRDSPIRELRRILSEEQEREKEGQYKVEKTIDTTEKRKTRDDLIEEQRKKIDEHSELAKMQRKIKELEKEISRNGHKESIKQGLIAETHGDKNEFKEDIVKGIIFSEILGKPKSIRK